MRMILLILQILAKNPSYILTGNFALRFYKIIYRKSKEISFITNKEEINLSFLKHFEFLSKKTNTYLDITTSVFKYKYKDYIINIITTSENIKYNYGYYLRKLIKVHNPMQILNYKVQKNTPTNLIDIQQFFSSFYFTKISYSLLAPLYFPWITIKSFLFPKLYLFR